MADGAKAVIAILILCGGSGLIGYNLAAGPTQTAAPEKPMAPKQVQTTSVRNSEGENVDQIKAATQCFGTLKEESSPIFRLLYLYRDGGLACVVGDPHAERLILDTCKIGEFCVVTASSAVSCPTDKLTKNNFDGGVPLADCTLLSKVTGARSEVKIVRPITKDSPSTPVSSGDQQAKQNSDAAPLKRPNLKVSWYSRPTRSISGHKPALDYEYFVEIQSADEYSVTLKDIFVNERNNCVVLTGGAPKMTFGDVFSAALNPFIRGCTQVLRVRLITDRGDMTYHFD